MVRRAGTQTTPVVLRVSWNGDAHPDALELTRGLRHQGVACTCDLDAGGDGDVLVSAAGARWSHLGRDEQGSVDAAVAALVSRAS